MGIGAQASKTYYTLVNAGNMLIHLQVTCGGLHVLNLLAIQNEMQCYHLESWGILEYINEIYYAQSKAERENNPITDAKTVTIATNAMLSTK